MGGLGNQMFQYALGRHLALKHGTTLKLDVSFLQLMPEDAEYTLRTYELDAFNIAEQFAGEDEIKKINTKSKAGFFFQRLKHRLHDYHIINEPHFHFAGSILNSPVNSYLEGYWQSEKYFMDIREQLMKDFSFRYPPSEENKKIGDLIRSENSVSLHIRRGDYMSNPQTMDVHGSCNISYYRAAIEKIKEMTGSPVFFIFSDEIEWAKKNIDFVDHVHFVDSNEGRGSEDLRLMIQCRHHIIANSSFSWWGAWLSIYPDKVVIGPCEWLKDKKYNTADILPETWIRI
jgi:hypothetical protein